MRWLVAAVAIVAMLGVVLYVLTRATDPLEGETSTVTVDAHDAVRPATRARGSVLEVVPAVPRRNETAEHGSKQAAGLGPREEREQLLARIRDPKAGYEPWDDQGLAILDSAASDATELTDVGCYMAGCVATFTFPSDGAYRRAIADLKLTTAYVAWTGGKQFTTPETLDDGRVVIAILLNRPD
jgi:hypothetical protein